MMEIKDDLEKLECEALRLSNEQKGINDSVNNIRNEILSLNGKVKILSELLQKQGEMERQIADLRSRITQIRTYVSQQEESKKTAAERVASFDEFVACETVTPKEKPENVAVPADKPVEKVSAETTKAESVQPVQPTQSTEPTKAVEPAKSVQPAQSTGTQQAAGAQDDVKKVVESPKKVQEAASGVVLQQNKQQMPQQRTVANNNQQSKFGGAQTQTGAKKTAPKKEKKSFFTSSDWEKFIGENLISKIGVLIIMIGVAIGAKYAIDHDMLSPTMRIAIGCVIGFALQGFAIKLKKNYLNFSAVLSSGSLAILYFMTYFAYDFYGLISMPIAFALMVTITMLTIVCAWRYNREIIAVFGQVGAYVVPFLLSDGSGNVMSLLIYIAIIDAGIFIVSLRKYWKIVLCFSYVASWLILSISYKMTDITSTSMSVHFLILMVVYFLIFHATFIAYKVRTGQLFCQYDVYFVLSNTLTFFSLGYNLMCQSDALSPYLGLFCLFNALFHLGVTVLLNKKHWVDRTFAQLCFGLFVLFATLTVAVSLTGHWITIFWMLEATILFWIGRTRKVAFYEKMSYPLLFVATISLLADWGNPTGAAFFAFEPLAELFNSIRSIWDSSSSIPAQSKVFSCITSVFYLLLLVVVLVIDKRYPRVVEDQKPQSNRMLVIRCLLSLFMTLVFLVFLPSPWLVLGWAIEAFAFFWVACINKNSFFYKSSLSVLGLASVVWLFQCFDKDMIGYSVLDMRAGGGYLPVHFSDMWRSIVEWLFVIVSCVAMLFLGKKKFALPEKASGEDLSLFVLRVFSGFLIFIPIIFYFRGEVQAILMALVVLPLMYLYKGKKYSAYETSSILSFLLSLILLSTVWFVHYKDGKSLIFLNLQFLVSVVNSLMLAGMIYLEKRYPKQEKFPMILTIIPKILLVVVFVGVGIELSFIPHEIQTHLWTFDYLLAYLVIVILLVRKCEKLNFLKLENFLLGVLVVSLIVTTAYGVKELHNIRLLGEGKGMLPFLRYLTIGLIVAASVVFYSFRKTPFGYMELNPKAKEVFYVTFLLLIFLVVGSSEINNLFTLAGVNESDKLAWSIFWGLCAVVLVYYGLFNNKKYLRIEGFLIFGVTLLKLFFYDLSHLNAFQKAIVFVVLGVFLLVASFFYQKINRMKKLELEGENASGKERSSEEEKDLGKEDVFEGDSSDAEENTVDDGQGKLNSGE